MLLHWFPLSEFLFTVFTIGSHLQQKPMERDRYCKRKEYFMAMAKGFIPLAKNT